MYKHDIFHYVSVPVLAYDAGERFTVLGLPGVFWQVTRLFLVLIERHLRLVAAVIDATCIVLVTHFSAWFDWSGVYSAALVLVSVVKGR